MRKLLLPIVLVLVMGSCKKDQDKISGNTQNDSLSTSSQDSASISTPENADHLTINPISEKANPGKTIFTQNGQTIISFDTQANHGLIKVNGSDYQLTSLNFTENNYEITGIGIDIRAEDGNFQEAVSDCSYGVFPTVLVKIGDKKVELKNVKVQDCPNYN